ncbi:putative aldose 1-epimerase [Phytophthora cinnamomi]|uniref:putative aldose 1-epimerase n=1 Tax=Phytophthora cinnamomi TaxID=4785 RepID=UPI00355A47B6|nr:putative aldose 1-epimerase [Phytophthora cinnamomi]
MDPKMDVLFMSKDSCLDGMNPIRGGIPVVFPNFSGAPGFPNHGFARITNWSVKVNDFQTATPESVAVKTRGITRGVTMGNYKLYEYAIPSSALVAGSNTITLSIASGSPDLAQKYLSPSVVFDALELSKTKLSSPAIIL